LTAKQVGSFWNVRDILAIFVQMGCELRVAEGTVYSEDGDCWNFRYLFNPANQSFVPIVDLSDDQFVSAGEVADWERRLGVTIPNLPTP
jgi:hypothetical protein